MHVDPERSNVCRGARLARSWTSTCKVQPTHRQGMEYIGTDGSTSTTSNNMESSKTHTSRKAGLTYCGSNNGGWASSAHHTTPTVIILTVTLSGGRKRQPELNSKQFRTCRGKAATKNAVDKHTDNGGALHVSRSSWPRPTRSTSNPREPLQQASPEQDAWATKANGICNLQGWETYTVRRMFFV